MSGKPMIMVVDDDRAFLQEMAELLTKADYQVRLFSDGEQATKALKRVKPKVILLDLKLGGKSGFQIANEIKEITAKRKIAVIAMTGFYTNQEYKMMMALCGIRECMIKPIFPLDAISRIEAALVKN